MRRIITEEICPIYFWSVFQQDSPGGDFVFLQNSRLLTLSRVTRGELRRESINLSTIAQEVVKEIQETEPNRAVEWDIMPGCITEGDPRLLRAVLQNLLGNSWKFTSKKEKGVISFGQVPAADAMEKWHTQHAIYFIRDNGAGFNIHYVEKLFAPFNRLHREEDYPGSGIGLATVQRIIQKHGGKIWAEGKVDEGATFYFTI